MKHSNYSLRLLRFGAIAVTCAAFALSAKAYDLTAFVATLNPISYQGQALSYDSAESETDEVYFDLGGSWAAPGIIIHDNGGDAIIYAWPASAPQAENVYEGTSPQAASQALIESGFTVGNADNGGTSTVSLGSADGGNLKGTYQVALWIFGAVLMLPIILKVRPA